MKKILYILPLLMISTSAQADWITLKNGDRISGDITSQDTSSVTMNTTSLGQITLGQDKIHSVHTGPATNDVIASAPAPEAVASIAPAAGEEERRDGVYNWTGRVSAGGTVKDGNSRSKTIVGDADIKARDKMNRFSLGGEANWSEDEGVKTKNDQQLYATYDRFISQDQKWFVGGGQTLERDEFANLDYRSKTGAFVGHQFYEQDDLNLQIKAGPNYIFDKFENGDSDGYAALGWALRYDQKLLTAKSLQVFHNHDLNTPFEDTGAFLFESETGVRVPLSKSLDASAQVDFDWDNDPQAGIREDDTTYAVKLGYGW